MSDLLFKELYKKCLRFLGIRLRSEKEIRDKIAEWMKKDAWAYGKTDVDSEDSSVSHDVVDRVIQQLVKDHFLDDRRFAEEWVLSRMRSKPRGAVILRMELAQKGIDRNLIDDVLDSVLHTNPLTEEPEDAVYLMAKKIGEKQVRKLAGEDERAFKFKMSQALARKGFEGGVIKRVVDELLSTRYNTQD